MNEPQVFFLPFAVPEPVEVDGADAAVLSRRIPDFLHHVLNRGMPGPTGMLEVQSPPGDGPVRWVTLSDVPAPEQVFGMLGSEVATRAVVAGTMQRNGDELVIVLQVNFTAGIDDPVHEIRARVPLAAPAQSLCGIARAVAKVAGIPYQAPPRGVLTSDPRAFYRFLEGLDGAALLSGDPSLEEDRRGDELVAPFADALAIDPCFGLALRAAAMTLSAARHGHRVGEAACYRLIDRCFESSPKDGEGCVAVAEQLVLLGDDDRAIHWLEHASGLEPPVPRALESLGVLVANRGDVVTARDLWLRGLALDGHPDFFAHLARLAFHEEQFHDAWDKVLRGLRRIYERAVRKGEWDDEQDVGILLRYLVEHLGEKSLPDEVVEAVEDLGGILHDGAARVDLGLCMFALNRHDHASAELEAGLAMEVDLETRDRGVRALLAIEIDGFESRFAKAADQAARGRDPRDSLRELQRFIDCQAEFWPALFFAGVALRRLEQDDDALDLMAEVLNRRPNQPDALREMALLFDRRGNAKRALECIDDAIAVRPTEAELHAHRGRFLSHLDRRQEAEESVEQAIGLDPANQEFRKLRRKI